MSKTANLPGKTGQEKASTVAVWGPTQVSGEAGMANPLLVLKRTQFCYSEWLR